MAQISWFISLIGNIYPKMLGSKGKSYCNIMGILPLND